MGACAAGGQCAHVLARFASGTKRFETGACYFASTNAFLYFGVSVLKFNPRLRACLATRRGGKGELYTLLGGMEKMTIKTS